MREVLAGSRRIAGYFFNPFAHAAHLPVVPSFISGGPCGGSVLLHKLIPPRIRYPNSHDLDASAWDLDGVSVHCRKPAIRETGHHLRCESAGEEDGLSGAAAFSCIGKYFERAA